MTGEHFDIFEYIRYRVFEMNESWDIFIFGMKGKSKSSIAYSIACLLNPDFNLDFWAFSTDEWIAKGSKCTRGDVIVFDEQGTQESGSSYEHQKKENKDFADEVQLNRTDGVINIGISLGTMRVINRVRNQYKVFIYPKRKLSNHETGGMGLYTECIIKYVDEIPFPENSDSDSHYRKKFFIDFDGCKIKTVRIPHPSAEAWIAYSKERQKFRVRVKENARRRKTGRKGDDNTESYTEKIERLQNIHNKK